MDILQILLTPFAMLLTFFYDLSGSYGVSIICFAIVVKIVTFPFSLKGKKGMIQMNMMSGQMQKLQKQYGNNRERYNEEVQRLYEREGVNPMGGCMWSMIPMFIILPLYAIIRQPLKYMMGLSVEEIQKVATAVDWNTVAVAEKWVAQGATSFADTGYNQLYLASMITEDTIGAVTAAVGDAANIFAMNFNFLGMNLAALPQWKVWENFSMENLALVILVFVSAGTGFLFSLINMKTNKMGNQNDNAQAAATNKTMMYTMPLMSLWIGFVMPAGLCVYWIANNLLSAVQEQISGKLLKKDYEAARLAQEERDRLEKEEEKAHKAKIAEERARRAEEKGKKKKPAAKKPVEETGEKVNRADSRIGMRPYALGRNYDPNRYQTKPAEVTAIEETATPEATTTEEVSE